MFVIRNTTNPPPTRGWWMWYDNSVRRQLFIHILLFIFLYCLNEFGFFFQRIFFLFHVLMWPTTIHPPAFSDSVTQNLTHNSVFCSVARWKKKLNSEKKMKKRTRMIYLLQNISGQMSGRKEEEEGKKKNWKYYHKNKEIHIQRSMHCVYFVRRRVSFDDFVSSSESMWHNANHVFSKVLFHSPLQLQWFGERKLMSRDTILFLFFASLRIYAHHT